ncbi:MAG TPA: tetratricopeptide repeat protein [Desulfobacterales bacterium]|nr:tetratricopeptide repeat protein [Desulfobacterales bacterium]
MTSLLAEKDDDCVKKTTLYSAMAVCLLAGFLGGIIYSSLHPVVHSRDAVHEQRDAGAQSQSVASANSSQQAAMIVGLEKQAALHPEDVEVWVKLGNAYFDTNQAVKAIGAYTKYLALHPGNAGVLTDLGVMYRRAGQPDKAIECFDKAAAIDPLNVQARFNKGIVLMFDKNDKAAAIKEWEALVKQNPGAMAPGGKTVAQVLKEVKAGGK